VRSRHRRGDQAYIVSIRSSAWLRNAQANPNVRLRIRGGTFSGIARDLRDAAESQQAMDAGRRLTAVEHGCYAS
jgi:F420H(2)-dependent quinone reductase